MKDNFIDYVKIFCQSGNGGNGSVHFLREKNNPKGGPDGGDGGDGGSIILKGNSQLKTLLHLQYQKHQIASNGNPGASKLKKGKDGKDRVIEVPLGTIIHNERNDKVGEIIHDQETKILLEGGKGGKGNWHFKSPTNRTPEKAIKGKAGGKKWYVMELKLLADIGLVGLPNAGKSTLLSKLSNAKPKIGSYPFTTLKPQLGIINYYDQQMIMADIPGIIKGAAEGKGLGLRFLRHIERNEMLLFLIDASNMDVIYDTYQRLLKELNSYHSFLSKKRRLLVLTKSDLLNLAQKKVVDKTLKVDCPYVWISAINNQGLDVLKKSLWHQLAKQEN